MGTTSIFREKFFHATGSMPEIISSIDHVFGSPPLRIIDGHGKLIGKNALLLIHDTTTPDLHRYRIDLTLDSGIYHSPDPDFFLYDLDKISCLSGVKLPNFELQYSKLQSTFECLKGVFNPPSREVYLRRFETLRNAYLSVILGGKSSGEVYKELLTKLYQIIGLEQHSKLVTSSMKSVYDSGIIHKFIPDCIEQTRGTSLGLKYLSRYGLFNTSPFQDISERVWDMGSYESSDLIDTLRRRDILPSYEIILWGLALAGITHFGNDYGFFKRLAEITETPDYSKLQFTKPKEDGVNFINFVESYSFSISEFRNKVKLQNNSPKNSRINNICVAYLHYGDGIKEFWRSYVHNGKITSLSMKEILE